MREILARLSLPLFIVLLWALMGYCGLVLIEVAFRMISK